MDEKKIKKIKEELLKNTENQVKKETTRPNNNLPVIINLDCNNQEIKPENAVEETFKVNEKLLESNQSNNKTKLDYKI